MRHVAAALVGFGFLLSAASAPAARRCGDVPGDAAAVDSAVSALVGGCCCRRHVPPRPRRAVCAVSTVSALVESGALPARCARMAVRRARRVCRLSGGRTRPCGTTTTTTSTLPPPRCTKDADCDDTNVCTADACVDGSCRHVCRCVGSVAETCCRGPSALCTGLHFVHTCGDPVCSGQPVGIRLCTTEKAGDPCTQPGYECDPLDGCGGRLRCDVGDVYPRSCPVSRRAAKRDVAYLSDADADRLRDELLRLRLATYRYRGEGPSASPRLGFVIDDAPASPAVAPGGTMVDVYAHASMAVAAIQAQERDITRLAREVDALRRACRAPPSSPR